MLSTIGKIFGTDKSLEKGLKVLDKAFYTKQEKAEDKAKADEAKREYILQWQKTTQGQNLSRRFIAITATSIWALQFIVIWIASAIAVFSTNEVVIGRINEFVEVTKDSNSVIAPVMMTIIGFYFAAPRIEGIAKAFRK